MGKFLGTYMQTCIIKILGNNFQQQLQHPITKKADAEPKKSRSNKKSRCRTSLLKNGPTKLPCLLIILASWVDFFDIGLLLYPVPHHTLQCCTRKSFWVTRTGESKLFCIGFSLFWSRCRTWGSWDSEDEIWSRFVFELVIWPQEVTLVRWTQPSGPLCLWQCFSGKTASNVMGVYGFDCPAIFWDLECSHFWGVAEGVLVH